MRALITGVTGQDGYYLSKQLARAGHEVWGMTRWHRDMRQGPVTPPWTREVVGDLLDQSSLVAVLKEAQPDVVYNLGAITFVGMSWSQPALMTDVTGLGVLRLLEAIRQVNPAIRLVHASSSEMFGNAGGERKDEATPLAPRSPYGVAKAFAHHTVINYRESYGMHCSAAIMFNHESPLRGPAFVTRKVCLAAAARRPVTLGRLDTERDWGWAPDYMTALPLIAALDEPRDYVLATGRAHSVAELCRVAYDVAGLDWLDYVDSNPEQYRPADIDRLCGNPARAAAELGWHASMPFEEIIRTMVAHDRGPNP